MEFIVYNQFKGGGNPFHSKYAFPCLCYCVTLFQLVFFISVSFSANQEINKRSRSPFLSLSLSLYFYIYTYTHIMLPDQRTSFYDALPMLNSWYESKPIKQEPPKQRTCLVSFSSEPPTVHTCKIKRPDIQRRTSSSDSGN